MSTLTRVLVLKLLRDVRTPLLAVCALLFFFSVLWVVIAQRVTAEIAPFFQGIADLMKVNKEIFDEVIFKGPGKVSQAVMGGGEVRFENPNDFLAVELLHPVILTLTGLWAVGRAAGAIAGELDRGTMELLISQPVPRHRLILAHLIVDAIVIPAVVLSIGAGVQAGLAAVGPFKVDYTVLKKIEEQTRFKLPRGADVLPVSTAGQPAALLNLAALMFAASGLTMAISSMNRSRWRAMSLAAALILGMFIVNVLGQLWEPLAGFRRFSLFSYYQPQKVWLTGNWLTEDGVSGVMVLATVGFLGFFAAWRVFRRRDLPAPL
jgi:ABC-2 type transport system permease protein